MDHEQIIKAGKQRMRPAEAAVFLGVSLRALEDWRAKKIGPPFVKVTRHNVTYEVAELKKFKESYNKKRGIHRPAGVAAITSTADKE
jgi:hypothetical protein